MNLVAKYVPVGGLIADLCAGQGAFSLRLLKAGYQVVPVDIDPRWFRVSGLSLVQADLNRPFAALLGEWRFDAVVCLEGIEHLENPRAFLRECRLLLRPKGILLLSSPNVECLISRVIFLLRGSFLTFDRTMTCPNHISPILSWLLRHHLGQCGFSVKEERFEPLDWVAQHNWKLRLLNYGCRMVSPFLDEPLKGDTRVVVAEATSSS